MDPTSLDEAWARWAEAEDAVRSGAPPGPGARAALEALQAARPTQPGAPWTVADAVRRLDATCGAAAAARAVRRYQLALIRYRVGPLRPTWRLWSA